MKKKWLLLMLPIVIVAIVVPLVINASRKQYEDVLMQMVVWLYTGHRNTEIDYFIVRNDGTFIRYRGLSRSRRDSRRTRNFVGTVIDREERILSEAEFQYVTERVDELVSADNPPWAMSSTVIMFLHNGNIYEMSSSWSVPLANLYFVLLGHETFYPSP